MYQKIGTNLLRMRVINRQEHTYISQDKKCGYNNVEGL